MGTPAAGLGNRFQSLEMSCRLGVKSTDPVSSSSSPHTPASHSTHADGPIRMLYCGSGPRRVPPPSSLIQTRYAMSQNNKPSLRVIYCSLHLDSTMIIIVFWSLGTLPWRRRTGSPRRHQETCIGKGKKYVSSCKSKALGR